MKLKPAILRILAITIATGIAFSLLTTKNGWCGHDEHHGGSSNKKATKREDVLKEIAELRAQAAKLEAALQLNHKVRQNSQDRVDAMMDGEQSKEKDEHLKHHDGGKVSKDSMTGTDSKMPMSTHGKNKMDGMTGNSSNKQSTGDEHSKHHGGSSKGGMGSMMGGGMGNMMGKMMEKMGAPKPKDLYPSLMSLPDLPAEERQEIDRKAHNRMKSGAELMTAGLKSLSEAAPSDNFDNMQKSLFIVREGLSQFDSGLAAHRAIAEGKAPRKIALKWFKKEMGLIPPTASKEPGGVFGMSWFHFSVMFLLTAFSLCMIVMYFFKMRRAEQLLQKIASASDLNTEKVKEK